MSLTLCPIGSGGSRLADQPLQLYYLLLISGLKYLSLGKSYFLGFFDIKKAFDTVPHQSLMDKLHRYGLDPRIQSWLNSYLSDRMQHVVVGGALSPDTPVVSGVPQGSVLGPPPSSSSYTLMMMAQLLACRRVAFSTYLLTICCCIDQLDPARTYSRFSLMWIGLMNG